MFRRAVPPATAFVVVVGIHILWVRWFPEQDPAQSRWAVLPETGDAWFSRYVEAGEYWLAYAYGFSGAFAVAAVRNLLEAQRASRASAAEGGLAAGSVTFAGAVAFGGCFLVGCCGSPIYKRLEGAPEVLGFRLGTLDSDPSRTVELHFSVTSKAPWVEIHDALPRDPGGVPFGERD